MFELNKWFELGYCESLNGKRWLGTLVFSAHGSLDFTSSYVGMIYDDEKVFVNV